MRPESLRSHTIAVPGSSNRSGSSTVTNVDPSADSPTPV